MPRRSVLVLVGLMLAGCSEPPFESTVSGVVTLDGSPIGPGMIQYVPVDRGHTPATGTIQVGGDYQLNTSNAAGVQPGEYDVTVAVYDHPKLAPGERAPIGSSRLRTPEKYFSLDSTDLRFTVEPGENTIDIPLVSEGEASTGP